MHRSNSPRRPGRRRHRCGRRYRNRDPPPFGRARRAYRRRRPQGQELAEAIKGLPASAEALTIEADVTQEGEVAEYVRAAVDKFGTIDVFYNNAGIEGDVKPIQDYSLESFRRVLDVNVVGVFLGMKYVLPVMLQTEQGQHHQHRLDRRPDGLADIAVYSPASTR